MLRRLVVSSVCVYAMTCASAVAHEGHGHVDHQNGVMHYVVNPVHSLPVLIFTVLAIAVVAVIRMVRRTGKSQR